MGFRRSSPADSIRGQQGFALVSVLLALLILAALYLGYFASQRTSGERATGVAAIKASHEMACRSNRQTIERQIALWAVNHPDEPPTLEALEHDGARIPTCPDGGRYDLVGTQVKCSLHR